MKFLKFRYVSGRLTIFLIDKNFKSLQVFSYDPDASSSFEKTAQHAPVACQSLSAHEKLKFWKIVWFIA